MKNNIFKQRYYKHIDKILDIDDVIDKIKDKEFIKHHSFYPLISYSIVFKKYCSNIDPITKHHWKYKERPIKYASHIDRSIYQWYSHCINNKYNDFCEKNGLNNVAIAYRTNLKGMTNVEFSKIAFDFIKECEACYVLVSDFSSFFDYVSHIQLKQNLCKVLDTSILEEDVYKVYKSMTKYTYIDRGVIVKYLIKNNYEDSESIKHIPNYFCNVKWYYAKKCLKNHIMRNNENYGIPQGSPLSGIFANVYMIDFDKVINEFVQKNKGLYMRYSDDLIIIIPKSEIESITDVWDLLKRAGKSYPTLKINVEKTSGYLYENNNIISLHQAIPGMKNGKNFISFLGFSFDGIYIKFRDKTLTKFFYKLYRKIKYMKKNDAERIKKGKKRKSKIDKHRLLKELNISKESLKKFIDYYYRARRVYKDEKYIVNFRKNVKNKIFVKFNQ